MSDPVAAPVTPTKKLSTPASRRWRILGLAGIALFCVLFAAMGTVFGLLWRSDSGRAVIRGIIDPNLYTVERQYPGVTSMNVLVLGVDRDYDNRQRVLKTNGRSDAILIARVDFVNKTIHALTIPRDTAVRIPGYRRINKINAAHQFGGPDLTNQTLREVFGVEADTWVTINFHGFVRVVDAIGGIDVNVKKRLKYDDNWGGLHINLYPGYQHLDGYQAMGFVRMRHSDSDEMRSKRQHEFLEAMRAKIKAPSTWSRLPTALDAIAYALRRAPNMKLEQMLALANFARSLPKGSIVIETLPSFEGPSYVTVEREKAAETIRRLFFPHRATVANIDTPDMRGYTSRRRRSGDTDEESVEAPPTIQEEPATDAEVEPRGDEITPGTDGPAPPPAGGGTPDGGGTPPPPAGETPPGTGDPKPGGE